MERFLKDFLHVGNAEKQDENTSKEPQSGENIKMEEIENMIHKHEVTIPEEEFKKGIEEYNDNESLEFVYDYAIFTVNRCWSMSEATDISEIAFALRAFLLT